MLDQYRNSKTERELKENNDKLQDFIGNNDFNSVMDSFNSVILCWKTPVTNERTVTQEIFSLEEAIQYIILYEFDARNPAVIFQRYIKSFNFLKMNLKNSMQNPKNKIKLRKV